MTVPFLRLVRRRVTPSGDAVFVWDLRLSQPQVAYVPSRVTHSLEHLLGDYLCKVSDAVVNVSPMGCGTGMYVVAIGIGTFEDMSKLLADALVALTDATEVPLANPRQCGRAEHHFLDGARHVAEWLLSRREEWVEAGPQAEEV